METTQSSTANQLKARLLCEGAMVADGYFDELLCKLNPYGVKRAGLGSGAKVLLTPSLIPVNFPIYKDYVVPINIRLDGERVIFTEKGIEIGHGILMRPPSWYGRFLSDSTPIERVLVHHGKQVTTAVYEDCALFNAGTACEFCVMRFSTADRKLRLKKAEQIIEALSLVDESTQASGIVISGGMTFHPARGMEILVPVVYEIKASFPNMPIAIEITPPTDLSWVTKLKGAGCDSLMMNLECWDLASRQRYIPGKNEACPRDLYLRAFAYGVQVFGQGKISTCFICGTEPLESLKAGIKAAVACGVVPSLLSGRHFEDVPNYNFTPRMSWQDFLTAHEFLKAELQQSGIKSSDKTGCVSCGMCDMLQDV